MQLKVIVLKEVKEYQTANGKIPFRLWLSSLKDFKGRSIIRARIDRLSNGNIGDCAPIGQGLFELRIQFGPGYRVYFGQEGRAVVILLCGGDKSSQKKDTRLAHDYWLDYRRRTSEEI